MNRSNECTKRIIETKQNYIAKMILKLDCIENVLGNNKQIFE